MAQIMFSRNPTGSIGLGVFLLGISVFLWSTVDPLFGPLATGCIGVGAVVAGLLALRHPKVPHIDPRQMESGAEPTRPIEPR
jgi:hypothetical protein